VLWTKRFYFSLITKTPKSRNNHLFNVHCDSTNGGG
jgi:hypothetical protein